MKPTLFATTVAISLVASTTSGADFLRAYFTEVGRNAGYGISDGYHAKRYCMPACTTCTSGSPMQQPMMPSPTIAPEHTQWAPHQLQQVRYPVGYYTTPMYQAQYSSQYQPVMPVYGQPMPALRPVARPDRSPASLW